VTETVSPSTPTETAAALRERFGEDILDVSIFRGEVTVVVTPRRLVEVCEVCRDEQGYDYLSDLTCVDRLDRDPRFDVVYHLNSMKHWQRLRLRTGVNLGESVPTVIQLWPAANWAEREVWDLFGVEFAGHPDLRRIMLPEGWVGHPLRKDYPQSQITLPRPKIDKTQE
jgi:NADH-quinone oxidoreductase subunit C